MERFLGYDMYRTIDCKLLINELYVSKIKSKADVQEELRTLFEKALYARTPTK